MTSTIPLQFGMVGARREHLERLRGYGFRRCEAVLIALEETDWLRAYLAGMERFSFHFPLLREEPFPDYPLRLALVDPDAERRRQAVALVHRELDRAAEWGARHIVVHLQRNLLEDDPAAPRDEAAGVALAAETAVPLVEHARAVGVGLHLENMMGCPWLYSPAAYAELARQVPGLQFCLDVGHAALDGRYFGFPETELAEAMGPHLGSLHVYDNHLPPEIHFPTLRESGLLRKYPVHPSHYTDASWIDTPGCLRAALNAQPQALVTFEVYYTMDTDHAQTAEGIAWTVGLCAEVTGAREED
jgi:sugar phosphate isomerase/epimerase